MTKKKTNKQTEEAVVEPTQEEETTIEKEDVVGKEEVAITKEQDKELRKQGLNANTSVERDIVQDEDTTKVGYDSIIEAVDEVMATHYKANKSVGVKRITNHVRKLLNQIV